jgi:alanine dehydrogenase
VINSSAILSSKKITAFAYEYIQDESGRFPIIQAMSEIVGSSCILIAGEYLSNTFGGTGELLGGVAGIPLHVLSLSEQERLASLPHARLLDWAQW